MKQQNYTLEELMATPKRWMHVETNDILSKYVPALIDDRVRLKQFVVQLYTYCKDVLDIIIMSSTGSVFPLKAVFEDYFKPDANKLPKRKPSQYGASTLRAYVRLVKSLLVKGLLFDENHKDKLIAQANATLSDADYEAFLYMLRQDMPDRFMSGVRFVLSNGEPQYKQYADMLISTHSYLPPSIIRKSLVLFDNSKNTESVAYLNGQLKEFLAANGLIYEFDTYAKRYSFDLAKNSAPDKSAIDDPYFRHAWEYGRSLLAKGVAYAKFSVDGDGVLGLYDQNKHTMECIRNDVLNRKFEIPEYVFHCNMLAEKYCNLTPVIFDGNDIATVISQEYGTVIKRQLQTAQVPTLVNGIGMIPVANNRMRVYNVESVHNGNIYNMIVLEDNPITEEQRKFNCISITDAKTVIANRSGGGGKYFYYTGNDK